VRVVGVVSLAMALCASVYGASAAVVGARRGTTAELDSARGAAYAVFLLTATAAAVMVTAILRNDFTLRYVAQNSSIETPLFFKAVALWSSDEGSLLLWNVILSGCVAAVAFSSRRRRPAILPWAFAILFAVQTFYLILVLGPTNPFAPAAEPVADGTGPLPLLQNHPLMAVHPPLLYLGLITSTVPFAFAVAAVVAGRLDGGWIRLIRRWALAGWVFLSLGLLLGALWSYQVLGWGGYWAWDPVENVALLPWLTTTAFLHSGLVEERRGMLAVWNLSLVVSTFALATLGTFLTRGDILSSVHTFARSSVGPMYLGFLALVLAGGFGLVAARAHLVSSRGAIDTLVSREAAFLGNNLLLVALTFTVLVGTIYPLVAEAMSGQKVSVGRPYFDRTTVPLVLMLLLLMGVGPLLPWRAGSPASIRDRLRVPTFGAALTVGALAMLGMSDVAALAAYGLASFAAVAAISELTRGVRAYGRATGRAPIVSILPASMRNRRLFGGLIAHLGLIAVAVGVTTSASFQLNSQVTMTRGASAAFAGYSVRFEGVQRIDQRFRQVVVATLTLSSTATTVAVLHPSLNFYPNATDAIGTPSLRVGTPGNLFRDLYATVVQVSEDGGAGTFHLYLNPGVMWLWAGGGVLVVGGLFALWPSRRSTLDRRSRRGLVVQEATERRPVDA
jgi:cytochrome c-type biogenesis protein CcmF